MINLAGRDILHSWGRFIFTGMGLGLLIGVILILGGLQFFPAMALGPIVEHFQALDAVAALR